MVVLNNTSVKTHCSYSCVLKIHAILQIDNDFMPQKTEIYCLCLNFCQRIIFIDIMNKIQFTEVHKDNDKIAPHFLRADGSVSIAKECYILFSGISLKYGLKYYGKTANKHRIRKWS